MEKIINLETNDFGILYYFPYKSPYKRKYTYFSGFVTEKRFHFSAEVSVSKDYGLNDELSTFDGWYHCYSFKPVKGSGRLVKGDVYICEIVNRKEVPNKLIILYVKPVLHIPFEQLPVKLQVIGKDVKIEAEIEPKLCEVRGEIHRIPHFKYISLHYKQETYGSLVGKVDEQWIEGISHRDIDTTPLYNICKSKRPLQPPPIKR